MVKSYVILTRFGYMCDWTRGGVQYTAKIENAALFGAESAKIVQKRVEGSAIMSTDGKLLELSEVTVY